VERSAAEALEDGRLVAEGKRDRGGNSRLAPGGFPDFSRQFPGYFSGVSRLFPG